MSEITIDDLAAPEFSEAARAILKAREDIPIEFSAKGVMQYAEQTSDVPIFIDEEAYESLERFMLEGDARGGFSTAGKKLLAATWASFIVQRSRLEALFSEHPEIADVRVEAPIVVAGIPRSGTTNLSNILASDSRIRALSFWESNEPFPSKTASETTAEERAELGRQALDMIHTVMPRVRLMYNMAYDDAMEELVFLGMAGACGRAMPQVYAPEWSKWYYEEMDPTKMYTVLKRSLQALNWLSGEDRRWHLKSPHHLGFLPALCDTFPDLHLVITHRDPASSTVSNATMNAYLFRETHDRVDPRHGYEVAVQMADGMIGGLVRDLDKLAPASLTQIHFHEYMADVMGTLESVYDAAELPFTDQARGELQAYIDAHPRGQHGGRLVYNPERDFGVTREQIRERYQSYVEKFGVRVERKHE